MNSAAMRVVVIVASIGRPAELGDLVTRLLAQSVPPARIVLSVVADSDLPATLPEMVEVVKGAKGLPAQRNTGLRHVAGDGDLVAFFDDDYLPSRFCLERMAAFFSAHPDVAGANGFLVADGINSAGIGEAEAEAMLEQYDRGAVPPLDVLRDLEGLYGCNMAYRASATEGVWFDERLKLYGWQEDIDFATQVSKRGRTVLTHAFAGVHRGVKGARTSGVRLGFAQVINPLYLKRKGTMSAGFAHKLMLRNVIANHAKALRPEPWVDRWGRVKGNWIGFVDALRGRLEPEKIERL